jgi:23S rRNA (pseudouridine1915-N3)-methyltransferase
MKITYIAVGKTQNAHIAALTDEYCRRLSHYLPFEKKELPELKNTKNLTEEQQKAEEGKQIMQSVAASACLILLDERGRQMRSVEWAEYLQKLLSAGRDLVFVSGGPYGFSKEVYARANGQISLSQMTFSHQMVRLFFTEQLYRAFTILRHEPYHHE